MADIDPYGIDLAISDDGDVVLAPNGDLALIRGPLNAAQALRLRLRTAPGELPLHPEYGSDLDRRIIATHTNDDAVALAQARALLRNVLATDRRFLAARNVRVERLDATGQKVAIACELELAGRDTVTVANVADPRSDETALNATLPSLDELTAAGPVDDLAFLLDDDELPELEAFISGEGQADDLA